MTQPLNSCIVALMESCSSHCEKPKKKLDLLLWGSLTVIVFTFIVHFLHLPLLQEFSHATVILMDKMWIGIVLGIIFVGLLSHVPREFVISALGTPGKTTSLLRATLAGLLLDLCSHGILLVGMKLYERGASLGQTMAFLIASPWNSLSLTIILISLVGWKWTLIFIFFSAVIAVISGWIFERLVKNGKLPNNPNTISIDKNFKFFSEAKKGIKSTRFDLNFFKSAAVDGLKGSKMILKWVFFGAILAAVVQTWVNTETLQTYFGPSILGISLTLVFATIIEVCSEGATPLAADLLTRAGAPGNSFAFLMTGVSTDYTEIMSIKETTRSWKIALFLPLITVPQIIAIALVLNGFVNL